MQSAVELLRHDAATLVFANVMAQQLGLPVPVLPTLLLAGSLMTTPGRLGGLLAAAVAASMLADWIWYHAGRRFGYRVLAGLCKLSINPASCVSNTEARFIRWGVWSLLVAKFVPGFSTVAPPIAGAMRMGQRGFLLASGAGAALWAGSALATGWWLKDAVRALIESLDRQAGPELLVVLLIVAAWLGWKLWQKYRFRTMRKLLHITADELIAAMTSGQAPLLLDLRGPTMVAETGAIPGARIAEHGRLEQALADWPREQPIVTLCACPEDAGAIDAARRLLNAGYLSVRPLQGGYAAWIAANGRVTLDAR